MKKVYKKCHITAGINRNENKKKNHTKQIRKYSSTNYLSNTLTCTKIKGSNSVLKQEKPCDIFYCRNITENLFPYII